MNNPGYNTMPKRVAHVILFSDLLESLITDRDPFKGIPMTEPLATGITAVHSAGINIVDSVAIICFTS
jgi:Txe/YoeB family toxin of Txe-Axe toxin-antitoxin module